MSDQIQFLGNFVAAQLMLNSLYSKHICVPTYCSHLWVSYNKSTYNKLCVAFNVFWRILGYTCWDSASNMFASNRLDNFDMLMRRNVNKFHVRVRSISKTLVTKHIQPHHSSQNTMWSKCMKIVYINYVP